MGRTAKAGEYTEQWCVRRVMALKGAVTPGPSDGHRRGNVGRGGGDTLKLQMYRAVVGEASDSLADAGVRDIRDWYERVSKAPSARYSLAEVTRSRCLWAVGFLLRRVAAMELENKELRRKGGEL